MSRMVRKIKCSFCSFTFSPLDETDFLCTNCFETNEPQEQIEDEKQKIIDKVLKMFPPEEEGITWEKVESPYKPYKS